MSTTKGFDQFVADLKQPEIWNRLGPQLALIEQGRWDRLLVWATRQGYVFTLADIQAGRLRYPNMLPSHPGMRPMPDGTTVDPAAPATLWTAASLQAAIAK